MADLKKIKVLYVGPWNPTGYGQACINNIAALIDDPKIDLTFKPIGNIQYDPDNDLFLSPEDIKVQEVISPEEQFDFQIVHWHHQNAADYIVSGVAKYIYLYTAFELYYHEPEREFDHLAANFSRILIPNRNRAVALNGMTLLSDKTYAISQFTPHLNSRLKQEAIDKYRQFPGLSEPLFKCPVSFDKFEKRKGLDRFIKDILCNKISNKAYNLFCTNNFKTEKLPISFLVSLGFKIKETVRSKKFEGLNEPLSWFSFYHEDSGNTINLFQPVSKKDTIYKIMATSDIVIATSRAEGWGLNVWDHINIAQNNKDVYMYGYTFTVYPFLNSVLPFSVAIQGDMCPAVDPPFFMNQGMWRSQELNIQVKYLLNSSSFSHNFEESLINKLDNTFHLLTSNNFGLW